MRIYHSLEEYQKEKPAILILGVFDGMHTGHQKLMDKALERKEEQDGEIVVCTFGPNINDICQGKGEKLVMTMEERLENLEDIGADVCIVCEFTPAFKNTSPEDFIAQIKSAIDPMAVVVGFDYRFGKEAAGDTALLQKEFDHVDIVDEIKINGEKVSSSILKKFIAQGDFRSYARFTGQIYVISGTVETGRGEGKKHNRPTANLTPPCEKVLPPEGVYSVLVQIGQSNYAGVANLGTAPTFGDETPKLEVFIINFEEDIYNKKIDVFFYQYLRPNQKFDSVQALYEQVDKDIEKTKIVIQNA